MRDSRLQKMIPDFRYVHRPQGYLRSDSITSLASEVRRVTCVAKATVIDHGKVHPHAWNMGRILVIGIIAVKRSLSWTGSSIP